MNLPNEIIIALSLFGFTGFLTAAYCFLKLRTFKSLAEENSQNLQGLERVLENYKTDLEKSISTIENQAQILALRSFDKQIEFENEKQTEVIEKTESTAPFDNDLSKQKMEILSLAGRGNDSRTIAEKLGLMTGEVELIVNLNRSLPSYF